MTFAVMLFFDFSFAHVSGNLRFSLESHCNGTGLFLWICGIVGRRICS